MDKVLTIFDFQKQFATEEDCFKYLCKLRWPEGFICPKCGSRDYSFLAGQKRFQCSHCRHQTSITSGTNFHKLHLSLKEIFLAVYLIATSKKGVSALELQRKVGIKSYKTAWLLMHKIRMAMSSSGIVANYGDMTLASGEPFNHDPIVTNNLNTWLMGTYNHIPSKYMYQYVNEFAFRLDRRWNLGNIFDKLLYRCITNHAVTEAELKGITT